MFKLFVLCSFLAVASAAPGLVGPIASPWGQGGWGGNGAWGGNGGWGSGLVSAPVVSAPIYSAPIVKHAVPVATSYANTIRIASPAAVVAHGPVVAAPYAHGPVVAAPLAHGW